MSAPILVTGAAGFVGSHLLDVLGQKSTRIVGWYRPDAGGGHSGFAPGVQWMAVELLDRDAVVRAVAEVRPGSVYHLAGAAHVADSWRQTLETYEGNVLATHHLFEAMHAADLRPRTLVSCSATIYRPQHRPIHEDDEIVPSSPYATSKLAQELLTRRAWESDGVPTLVARSFNHTGPRQPTGFVAPSIARQIACIEADRQAPVLTMGNLEPRRDLTDVRDTVKAYVAMMESGRPGVPYNVCSGRELSIATLVAAFVARARRPVTVVQDPDRFRPNDVPLLVGSHDRLTRDTGWTPGISLEQTVDDLLAYWRHRVGEE